MNEVLVLRTDWAEDYWERDKTAPYPKQSIASVRHLKHVPEIPGIGIYTHGKKGDLTSISPCFITIRNIDENEKGDPQFQFHFIQKIGSISSVQLTAEIGRKGLFFSLPTEEILGILTKHKIKPPPEWTALFGKQPQQSWQSWIGEHYLRVLRSVSTTEYEDKVSELFRALGFEVDQLGYRREGEYPDGIAYSKDFSIVYDCKNSSAYFLDAKDRRAITKYIQDAKRRIKEKLQIERVYFAIVAHSYDQRTKNLSDIEKETSAKGILLTSETLLYLLYKKLVLGRSFLLADFEGLISAQAISIDIIDKVYNT